jgi:hypothetical protein
MSLPQFPLPEFPQSVHQATHLKNLFDRLESTPGATLSWEQHRLDDFGDPKGEWHVSIDLPRTTISFSHPDYLQALNEAVERAEKHTDEAFKAREAQRAAALAKLTPEERKLLHLP